MLSMLNLTPGLPRTLTLRRAAITLIEMRSLLGLPSGLVRATARLLVVALSVTTVGPVMHELHDEELQSVVVHDESQHHFQAAPDAPDSPGNHHCVACHFVRTSYGPASWVAAGIAALATGTRLVDSDGLLVAASFASPRPARAPPVLA
jgi:hypothetical protein